MRADRWGCQALFKTRQELNRALERIDDSFPIGSRSLIVAADRRDRDPGVDPFGAGFLSALDRRIELMRLLRELDERSQRLLMRWFAEGRPVVEIARELKVSRVHCYRLRDKALDAMLAASPDRVEPADELSRAS